MALDLMLKMLDLEISVHITLTLSSENSVKCFYKGKETRVIIWLRCELFVLIMEVLFWIQVRNHFILCT